MAAVAQALIQTEVNDVRDITDVFFKQELGFKRAVEPWADGTVTSHHYPGIKPILGFFRKLEKVFEQEAFGLKKTSAILTEKTSQIDFPTVSWRIGDQGFAVL